MTDKKYCIQLAECDGNSKEVYSFDEVEIGTWVDGKPIYRKVISGKIANESGNALVFANVSELMVDRIINFYGNMIDKNNRAQITLQTSYNATTGLDAAVNLYYRNDDCNIYYHFKDNGFYPDCTAYVVIEYTKK
ncbi:hypothetical protein [Lacrimispora sp.]|uniref:hypothetical protein n=1 Tax=Lacrimispora sp. TaxID=2719234 RepID=UPI0028AF8722|nr:hypothetical protein [Lacrimispora sp.]